MVPPPMPVTVAIRQKPTISICLRDAVSAPLAANTATPHRSSHAIHCSNATLPCGYDQVLGFYTPAPIGAMLLRYPLI